MIAAFCSMLFIAQAPVPIQPARREQWKPTITYTDPVPVPSKPVTVIPKEFEQAVRCVIPPNGQMYCEYAKR